MSKVAQRLRSLARALTNKPTLYGIVLKKDKAQVYLHNPRKVGFVNSAGGVHWCAEHDNGLYMVEASLFAEYLEVTSNPNAVGGKIDIKSAGSY